MAVFGNTDVEPTSASLMDTIRGSYFTCPKAGIAESITVYLDTGGNNETVKCAIYKHSDNSLVGETEERTDINSDGGAWFTFNFTSPKPELSANTDYWLVAWNNPQVTAANIFYDSTGESIGGYDLEEYGSWPDPWSPTVVDTTCSIYCTYTPFYEVEITHSLRL